jgi:hypothetical protein
LNGSPSVGKITRGKTHELIIQLHGEVVTWANQTKSSRNFIWEKKIITFGTCTKVLEYFENGSIKEYKNRKIKI